MPYLALTGTEYARRRLAPPFLAALMIAAALIATPSASVASLGAPRLLATTDPGLWESMPVPRRLTVFVHLYRNSREIDQVWLNPCAAYYADRELYVRLTIRGCRRNSYRVRLRYISLARAVPVVARLSRR